MINRDLSCLNPQPVTTANLLGNQQLLDLF